MSLSKTGRVKENVKLNLDFVKTYFRLGFPIHPAKKSLRCLNTIRQAAQNFWKNCNVISNYGNGVEICRMIE